MRMFPLLVLLVAPFAAHSAHAESLRLDDDAIAGAQRLLLDDASGTRAASELLPAFLDQLAAANAKPAHTSSSSDAGILSGVGVGLQIGTPTALTFKFGAGGNANIVLGIGAFLNEFAPGYAYFGGLSLHGDYLFTLATLVNNGTIDLTAYLGPGLWVNLFAAGGYHYGFVNGVYYAGAAFPFAFLGRLPLGLNLRFGGAPIEIYLELDPALLVFPGLDFFIGASLGFRWFF